MLQGEAREIAGELPLSANAVVVLKKRYLKKDESGEVAEGAPEMFRRVGRAWFKGLGDVPVWEIAADTGGPAALFQAMREAWWAGPA